MLFVQCLMLLVCFSVSFLLSVQERMGLLEERNQGSSLNFRNQLCRGVQFNTICRAFLFMNVIFFPSSFFLFSIFIVVMILNSKA